MNLLQLNFLAQAAGPSWFSQNWQWLTVTIIVVIGLVLIGHRDLARFSLRRAWAISSVCFRESIRKRVLLLIPLAVAGVVIVVQCEKARDESDALRQTIKFCQFTTGLVVVLSGVILACTSIPKDIETRVVYTVVTKPVTRLEIVLGKIIGFARVALTIVIIMGLFTWGYVRLRAIGKNNEISMRLQDGNITEAERQRISTFETTGLLTARSFWAPDELQVYGREPDPANDKTRVISGASAQDLLAGFQLDHSKFFGPAPENDDPDVWSHSGVGVNGLVIRVEVKAVRTGPPDDQPPSTQPNGAVVAAGPQPVLEPMVGIELLDENRYSLIADNLVGGSDIGTLRANIAQYVKGQGKDSRVPPAIGAGAIRLGAPTTQPDGSTVQYAYCWVTPDGGVTLFNHPSFFVCMTGRSGDVDFQVTGQPIHLFVPRFDRGVPELEPPGAVEIPPSPDRFGDPEYLVFRGRTGTRLEQQIDGGSDQHASAVFRFRNAPPSVAGGGQTPFQIIPLVTRGNSELLGTEGDDTILDIDVIDYGRGLKTASTSIDVENNRPAFFSIDSSAISSGNYELALHCRNSGDVIGLQPNSLQMVRGLESFEYNLAKSLGIIWMMSVLVISLAIFASTFLSWPIAIVLTIVLLVGRWGVTQLADANQAGLGKEIVNDFKFTDAATASVVSSSVDTLTKTLDTIAVVMPDLSRFDAIVDVANGTTLPNDKLMDSLMALLGFALPAGVIAYVIMKNKEVAP